MPLSFYDLIHVIGLVFLTASLGAALQQRFAVKTDSPETRAGESGSRTVMLLHGIAMILLLLGGFGALAKLGMTWPLPGFVYVKLVIWLILGMTPRLIRKGGSGALWWTIVLALASFAAYLGIFKPF